MNAVGSAVRKKDRRTWTVRTVILLLMPASPTLAVASSPTAADADAEHEFQLASAEIRHINDVLEQELTRLLYGKGGTPSPEVTRYSNPGSARPISLGDATVPLHLRLIERQRQQIVQGVALGRRNSSLNCREPNLDAEQFTDPAVRIRVKAAILCNQQKLNEFQSGVHAINEGYEKSLLELKLPPFTQERMRSADHASTLRQDAELAEAYEKQRKINNAGLDILNFLEAHAPHIKQQEKTLLFESQAEADEFGALLKHLQAISQ